MPVEAPGEAGGARSLADSFNDFLKHRSPRVLLPVTAAALSARLALGGWRRRDLAIAASVLAAEPFTEWVIHVGILHFRPRTARGRTVDPLLAREHRAHHADPRDPRLVFVPMPVVRALLPGSRSHGSPAPDGFGPR